MRISDWSSDVCSSDLPIGNRSIVMREAIDFDRQTNRGAVEIEHIRSRRMLAAKFEPSRALSQLAPKCRFGQAHFAAQLQIGRASCRARVCHYVLISVVAVQLKTNNNY